MFLLWNAVICIYSNSGILKLSPKDIKQSLASHNAWRNKQIIYAETDAVEAKVCVWGFNSLCSLDR